jgi:RimJ/RimL family protein N-acetyltransferase
METKRLIYRKFEKNDFDALFEILHNDNVTKFLPDKKAVTKERCEQWLNYFISTFDEKKKNTIYALVGKSDQKLIGYAGVAYVKEFDLHEIMYGLHEDYWGRGLATEAAWQMKDLADSYKLNKVIALADPYNFGSNKIVLKLGYELRDIINLWGMNLNYFEMEL